MFAANKAQKPNPRPTFNFFARICFFLLGWAIQNRYFKKNELTQY